MRRIDIAKSFLNRGEAMKVTTYGGQTIHLPAGQVLVESEALDSLKAMAQRLQTERDELLHAVIEVEDALEDGHWQETKRALRNLIAKCTAKPKVLE